MGGIRQQYVKKTTTELMTAIQLGIGQSVGSLTSKPERDVLMQDFSVVEQVSFPENGSNFTPAHRVGDFKFKTYAPIAFRYFRELFGIRTDDFLASLCTEPLTELSNPGASGSIFFITDDDEFIIKTVEKKEADFLQKLLPGYYMNLNQNPRTLLPKFYGLYCYQQPGKNIRFVVMNNLLPSYIKMHEKYDLKGSTYKRKASKHELAKSAPTFKDLDFRDRNPEGLLLEADTYEALMKTIRRDCRVLESFKIMDYSQLLAIHNLDEAKRLRTETGVTQQSPSSPDAPSTSQGAEATPGTITKGRSTKQRLANFSTALESIQAEVDPVELEDDDDDVPPGGIPARNAKGERLLLYVGIIDILQSYRLIKKFEHGFKSIVHDGDSISVHRPSFYAQRFQGFFERDVFKKISSLDAPAIAGANARFRKIVHTVNFAIRSPSRKKGQGRTRSATDPASENSGSTSTGGALIHKNKPDLIAQASDNQSSRPVSSHHLDAHFSETTINSSAFSASSVSSNTSAWSSGMAASSAYQSKESHGYLPIVKETPSNSSRKAPQEHHMPPVHDEPLPPYSERSPVNADPQRISITVPGNDASTNSSADLPPVAGQQEATGVTSEVITPTATALVTETHTESQVQKSSFRRERSEKPDIHKRGVRFSCSDDGQHESDGSAIVPSSEVDMKGEGTSVESPSSNSPCMGRRDATCTAQSAVDGQEDDDEEEPIADEDWSQNEQPADTPVSQPDETLTQEQTIPLSEDDVSITFVEQQT